MMHYVGETLVFAVAQHSFEINGNQFSTLVPLMTLSGELLKPSEFPNRGLAWWMVRGSADVVRSGPGRLLVGTLQEANLGITSDPEKDLFQVDFDTVQVAGPKRIIEIITLDGQRSLSQQDILRSASVVLDHEPSALVAVRLSKQIVGPFRVELVDDARSTGYRIRFLKASSDRPIFQIDQGELPTFRFNADVSPVQAPRTRYPDLVKCHYEVALWGDFDRAALTAKTIRLSTDEEVISRVAKSVMSRSKRQDLTRLLKELAESDETMSSLQEDISRVQELARQSESESVNIDRLVESIVGAGFLNEALDSAVTEIASRTVAERASSLRAEAEAQLRELRRELEELQKDRDSLVADLERQRRSAFADLKTDIDLERATAEQAIASKEEALARRENELALQSREIEAGLVLATEKFVQGKRQLVADLLALTPILENVGALGKGHSPPEKIVERSAPTENAARPLSLPSALAQEHVRKSPLSEEVFFERFERHVSDCGFSFHREDLVAFHIATKCSDLTIIGGASGTGKSSLPKLYSQALAGQDIDLATRFLAVDVSSAWTGPSDLLGYVNLLDHSFYAGSSGIFTHVVWADLENKAKGGDSGLYLVCLDEMNLAHVEHYFSGFIQALSRAPGTREVAVFDQTSVSETHSVHPWHRLKLHENIRFVGTVNFDETTRPISQRVLDRADLLRIEPGPLLATERKASTQAARSSGEPVVTNDVRSWIYDRPLEPGTAQLLEELQPSLRTLGCPLTPRRAGAIARSLGSTPLSLCSPEVALDMQIAQRILPQIKGLFRQNARESLGHLAGILSKHESKFERSLRMIEDLRVSEEVLDPAAWGDE